MGKSSTMTTWRGILKLAIWPRQKSMSSRSRPPEPWLESHEGHRDLGQPRVGQADHGGQIDGGMAHREGLDLHGVDVLPADLEHVLVAPHEAQVAVGPDDPHVARVHPARFVDGPRRLLRIAEVPAHGEVTSHQDFAGRFRRLVMSGVGIDHADLVAGRRIAGGLHALLLGGVEEAHGDAPTPPRSCRSRRAGARRSDGPRRAIGTELDMPVAQDAGADARHVARASGPGPPAIP